MNGKCPHHIATNHQPPSTAAAAAAAARKHDGIHMDQKGQRLTDLRVIHGVTTVSEEVAYGSHHLIRPENKVSIKVVDDRQPIVCHRLCLVFVVRRPEFLV
jgi:hypothetical protein